VQPTDPLSELLAKQAITEVIHRYCRGIDRMDRELTRSCWHVGGTADYGAHIHQGTGDSFVEWVWPVHEQGFSAHSHQITNVLIEVDPGGERAVSEAYVTVTLRTRDGDDIVDRGRYLDRWERRDGRWAIAHRRHVSDVGSVYRPVADAGGGAPSAARRGRDDPSYELG
jgi:hypothetical protein